MIATWRLFRAMRWLATGMLVCLFAAYVATYVTLRNRSLREMGKFGADSFLYDSADTVFRTHDMSDHNFRRLLFAPANYVDRKLFGGPSPVICIMFDIE